MAFSDWSTNAASNTNVGGINIAENCPPGNLNNAEREIMAELRVAFNPALDVFHASTTIQNARTTLGALSVTGDTMYANIVRSGAGPHLYHASPSFGSGRLFFTAVGASDPTNAAGDIWVTGS